MIALRHFLSCTAFAVAFPAPPLRDNLKPQLFHGKPRLARQLSTKRNNWSFTVDISCRALEPPGSTGLPFIGETLDFIFDKNFVQKRVEKYKSKIFKTNLLGRDVIGLTGAENCRIVLQTEFDSFSWKGGWPKAFEELLGQSLFLQEGEEHKRNRRLLMPSFHGAGLAQCLKTIGTVTEAYVERWAKNSSSPLTLRQEFGSLTFDVMSELLFGVESGSIEMESLKQDFATMTKGIISFPEIDLPFTVYGRALRARDRLLAFLRNKVKERHASGEERQDVLGLLMSTRDEEGNSLSDEEIVVQTLLLLFAGYETSANFLTNLTVEIAQRPDIWMKLIAEQENIFSSVSKEQRRSPPSLDQLKAMPYLDQVLMEVERLYAPVSGSFRLAQKDVTVDGYLIPKGTFVQLSYRYTHLDPTYWSNPVLFDPERFGPNRLEHKKNPFCLLGFGGGPRNCLGQTFALTEMKIIVSLMLRLVTWDLQPDQDLTRVLVPMCCPKSGGVVVMSARDVSRAPVPLVPA